MALLGRFDFLDGIGDTIPIATPTIVKRKTLCLGVYLDVEKRVMRM